MRKYEIILLGLFFCSVQCTYSMQQHLQLAEKFINIFPMAQQPLSHDMSFLMSQVQDKLDLIVPLLQDLDENKLSVQNAATLNLYLEGLKGSLIYLTDLDNASFECTFIAMSLFHRVESVMLEVQKTLDVQKLVAVPAMKIRKKSVTEKKIEEFIYHFDDLDEV